MSDLELEPVDARAPKPPEPVHEPSPAAPERGGALFDTGLGTGMGAPTLLRHLERRPPEDRRAGIEDLNGRVGNRQVSRMIMRYPGTMPVVDTSPDIDLATATDDQKLAEIRTLMDNHGFFSPTGTTIIEVWNSFGERLPEVANANMDLWERTVALAPGLVGSSYGLRKYRDRFKGDVEQIVLDTLDANRQFVIDNMTEVGLPMAPGGADAAAPTAEQNAKLAEQQKALELAGKAMNAKQLLLQIPVGHLPEKDHDEGGDFDVGPSEHVDYFNPSDEPDYPAFDEKGFTPWAEVKERWDTVQMFTTELMSRYPIVQSMLTSLGGEGTDEYAVKKSEQAVEGMAKMSPEEARKFMSLYLRGTLAKIEEAVPLVGDDLDYHDFEPVHARLFAGHVGGSGTNWSLPFESSVAKMDVRAHNFGKILSALALGTLSAAAFLLAEFATAGMATFLLVGAGIGVGAAQAAMSWDEYADLATAHEASTNPKATLIAKEQVESAAFAAVLDTVFVFADVAGAVGPFSKAARASRGMVEATGHGLEMSAAALVKHGLAEGGPGAITALRKGLGEIGLQGTMAASGKSVDDLIAIAGRHGDMELVAKLTVMGDATKSGTKSLEKIAASLPDLAVEKAAGRITGDQANALVRESIEQFGMVGTIKKAGGWKTLTKALGDASPVAQEMDAWRKALLADLQQWVQKQSDGAANAIRTGNEKLPTNDLDINMMELGAEAFKDRAKQFLAGRAGVRSDELNHVLDASFMVDPTRMHLQDLTKHGLPDAVREELRKGQILFDEQMLYGRRIHDAGPGSAKADAIAAEARARGITPMEFKPLSESQSKALGLQVDDMMRQLEGATDEAAKKDLIMRIHQSQAMINASTQDAYLTAGGVALNVSKRDIDKAKMPQMFDEAVSDAERYGAALDESTFLDKARREIMGMGAGTEGLAARMSDEVKALGKHGERMAVHMGKAAGPEALEKLVPAVDRMLKLIKDAKSGKIAARTKAAKDVKLLQAEVRFNLKKLEGVAETRLKEMRLEAKLGEPISKQMMEEIQAAIAFRASVASLAAQVDAITMAIGELAQGAIRVDNMEDDTRAPNASHEPNASYQ